MKKISSIAAFLCGMIGCTAQNAGFKSLSVNEFESALTGTDVLCLDVRTADEYAEGHIADAINVDVQRDDFEARAVALLPKDKTVAVYCRSGRRSKTAANILVKNGYSVVELSNGYNGWTREGRNVTKEAVDYFVTEKGTDIFLYCVKHGSIKMRIGDKWLYVDPVTKGAKPETDYSQMPKADFILITHEHGDHLDKEAIEQLQKEGTSILLNKRSTDVLGGIGTVMSNGESKSVAPSWTITAVPAYNTSADKQQFHPKGRDNGYLLDIEGFRILVAGDTEDIPELSQVSGVNVAFLPCNLPYTMSVEQLCNAARAVKPAVLFPYHFGNTDIKAILPRLSGMDVRLRQYQ